MSKIYLLALVLVGIPACKTSENRSNASNAVSNENDFSELQAAMRHLNPAPYAGEVKEVEFICSDRFESATHTRHFFAESEPVSAFASELKS